MNDAKKVKRKTCSDKTTSTLPKMGDVGHDKKRAEVGPSTCATKAHVQPLHNGVPNPTRGVGGTGVLHRVKETRAKATRDRNGSPRGLCKRGTRGWVWRLDFNSEASDPRRTEKESPLRWGFFFTLTLLSGEKKTDFRMPGHVETWLEDVIAEAYQRVGGVGNATVVPSKGLIELFSDANLHTS